MNSGYSAKLLKAKGIYCIECTKINKKTASQIKEIIYYMNITLCLLILYLVYRVLKRIFITGKMHCDTNIPTKFSQTQDKAQDKENI